MSLTTTLWKWHVQAPGYALRLKAWAWAARLIPGSPEWPRVYAYTMVEVPRLKALEHLAVQLAHGKSMR